MWPELAALVLRGAGKTAQAGVPAVSREAASPLLFPLRIAVAVAGAAGQLLALRAMAVLRYPQAAPSPRLARAALLGLATVLEAVAAERGSVTEA